MTNMNPMFPWAEQLREAMLRGGVDIGGMPLNDAMLVVVGRIASLTEQLEAARRDAKEAEAYAAELEVELDRLRLAAKLAKSTADEWAISRAIGDQRLEGDKADALWKAMRRLSAIADGPIQPAAAEGEK